MEKSSKAILWLLGGAILAGTLVLLANPEYRATFAAWRAGTPTQAPIWQSNEAYYDAVDLRQEGTASDASAE